jgi:hypothetical protein
MIQEELKLASSLKEQCEIIWNHYISRRLNNNFEPQWIHHPYEAIKDFLDSKELPTDSVHNLRDVIKSHLQKDGTEVPVKTGFPNEGTRLMHDCWKAGSFTWIFMGRSFCENIHTYKNFVIVNRKLPDDIYALLDGPAPQTLYAAYTINKNWFAGPAVDLEQLIEHLDQQEPAQF